MKLFYRHFGSGMPVIILHGLLGTSDNWVTQGKRLANHFSVYLLDLRNHGQSPHSPSLNYSVMSDDLLEFMEDHAIKQPIIIGHSMGGKVAMTFALNHPEIVDRLVVIDISPFKYTHHDAHYDIISAMMSIDFSCIYTRDDVSEMLKTSIPSEKLRLFVMKNLYRKTHKSFAWRLDLDSISNNLDQLFAAVESNDSFDKPTLFVRGGLSDYIGEDQLIDIRQLFIHADLVTIERAGHWIHSEFPRELCDVMHQFLGKKCLFE